MERLETSLEYQKLQDHASHKIYGTRKLSFLKSSTKGNECSLDYCTHPIDIKPDPFSKDRARCRIEPI